MSMFGRLGDIVAPCRWQPRWARVSNIGGPGSGKTFGALRMATGMVRDGGVIVLLSAGESRAEELYSHLCDFYHVDMDDVCKSMRLRDTSPEGTDPRAVNHAVAEVAGNVPPGSVVIVDSVSDAWDGAKAHIDRITGGNQKRNQQAWATVTPWWSDMWRTIETCPAHVILTVRAKTMSDQEKGRSGRLVTVQTPTDQDNRNRDQFRTDVRVFIDSMHRVWCEGRLTGINESPPASLDAAFGSRLVAYLATGRDPGMSRVDVNSVPVPGSRVIHPSPANPDPQRRHPNRPPQRAPEPGREPPVMDAEWSEAPASAPGPTTPPTQPERPAGLTDALIEACEAAGVRLRVVEAVRDGEDRYRFNGWRVVDVNPDASRSIISTAAWFRNAAVVDAYRNADMAANVDGAGRMDLRRALCKSLHEALTARGLDQSNPGVAIAPNVTAPEWADVKAAIGRIIAHDSEAGK